MVLAFSFHLLGISALLLATASGAQGAQCPFPHIQHGRAIPIARHVYRTGDTVSFTCSTGYTLHGSRTSVCQADSRWSPPLPLCRKEVTCPRPPNIANGLHSGQSLDRFPRGMTVHYSCQDGYAPVGNVSVNCTEAGMWSWPLPRCEAIGCEMPEVQHGKVYELQSTFRAGESLHFDCDAGYAAEGSYEAQCQPGGTWDPPVLRCERVRPCPMPPEIPNGSPSGQGKAVFTMGMSVIYTCDPGYYLVGNAIVFCKASGNWSQPRPRCEAAVCVHPYIRNGRQVDGQGLLSAPGQVVTFQCHDGYSLQGSAKVTCQEDGSWHPPVPICGRLYHDQGLSKRPGLPGGCGPPTRLHFAELKEEHKNEIDFSVGKTVQYTCHPGYARHPGMSPTITCLETGVWSEALEFCKRKQCKYPETPKNGRVVVLTDLLFGSTVSYTCEEGHRLVGQSHRRCEVFGPDVAWSGLLPICQKVVCPAPKIQNGRVSVLKYHYTYKDTVSFKCHKGFTLRGSHTAQCQADKTWDPPVPVCEQDGVAEHYHHPHATAKPEVKCQPPPSIVNGEHSGRLLDTFHVGTLVRYRCKRGFSLIGNKSVRCTTSGVWSHPPPRCKVVKCLRPPNITNGKLKGNISDTFSYGASISYSCNPGYSLVGNAFLNCTVKGTWSQPPQCKEIRCVFPEVQGVKKAIRGNTYRSGTNITLECDDGYTLEGISQIQCQEDFSWDPPIPACKLTSHKSGSVGVGVIAAGVLLLLGAGVAWKIISKQKEGYYDTYENRSYQIPLNEITEPKCSCLQ